MKKIIVVSLMLIFSLGYTTDKEFLTHLSDDSFKAEVLDSDMPVLVDFWAPWCGPCKTLGPIIEELAEENHEKMKFAKINVDDHKRYAGAYGIRSIPTVGIFVDGKPVDGFVGLRSKLEITDILNKHMKDNEVKDENKKEAEKAE